MSFNVPHKFERTVLTAMDSPRPGFIKKRTWHEAARYAIAKNYPAYLEYIQKLSEIAKDTIIDDQKHDTPVHR